MNNEILTDSMCPLSHFYHRNGSSLRTSQKHQLCEDTLTNEGAKEDKKK